MQKIACSMTVFFENPFYVAVVERQTKEGLQVARVVFGTEPKEYDVYALVLERWHKIAFSSPLAVEWHSVVVPPRKNPKRAQRDAAKLMGKNGVGTKAQQALSLQHELGKAARKRRKKQDRQEWAEQQFLQRQEKKKRKKRGR